MVDLTGYSRHGMVIVELLSARTVAFIAAFPKGIEPGVLVMAKSVHESRAA